MPAISVITPTFERPVAMALARRWMARQTRRPDEWIVADKGGGHPPGAPNFLANLRDGLARATGDLIIWWEDDEWYRPDHLEMTARLLETHDLVGGIWQPYYNVRHRVWKLFRNHGSSLCQTGMKRELLPILEEVIGVCEARGVYGVDGRFWRAATKEGVHTCEYDDLPAIGIKSLPGSTGLGLGHRPDETWATDLDLAKLREWVGDDAEVYREFLEETIT